MKTQTKIKVCMHCSGICAVFAAEIYANINISNLVWWLIMVPLCWFVIPNFWFWFWRRELHQELIKEVEGSIDKIGGNNG